jgi:hypothetical protein
LNFEESIFQVYSQEANKKNNLNFNLVFEQKIVD